MKSYEELCAIIDGGGSVFLGGQIIKDKTLVKDAMEAEKTFAPKVRTVGIAPPNAELDAANARIAELEAQLEASKKTAVKADKQTPAKAEGDSTDGDK